MSAGNVPWASTPSDGTRSRSLSRRSKSILQKAKIWEAVDERPEESSSNNYNNSNFATLPWSTKFEREAHRNLAHKGPLKNVMQKTCSSPSIFDMVQKPMEQLEIEDESKAEKRLSLPPVSETDAIFSQIASLAYLDEAAEVSKRAQIEKEKNDTFVEQPEIDISLTNTESEERNGGRVVSSESSESTTVIEKGEWPNEKVNEEEEEEKSVNRQEQEHSEEEEEEADTEDALERSLSSTARELSAILTSQATAEDNNEDRKMPSVDKQIAADEEKERKKIYDAEQSYFDSNLSPLVSFPHEEEEEDTTKVGGGGVNSQRLMSVEELTERGDLEQEVVIAKDVTEPEHSSSDKIPNFVLIREISLDPARTFDFDRGSHAVTVPEIRIELCDEDNDNGNNDLFSSSEFDQEELTSNVSTEDDFAIIDNEGVHSSSCTPPEDVIEGSAERESVKQGQKDKIFLTVPEDDDYFADQDNKDEDDFVEELQDDDLELVEVSENGSSVCEDDDEETAQEEEFESLRMRRMRSQRSVMAPERDVSEDDTETAEFQTRLRKLSNTSLPSSGNFPFGPPLNVSRFSGSPSTSPILPDTPSPSPEPPSEKPVLEEAETVEDSHSRGRESEAPEREIETEDKESAELQTNLRRSRSSEIFLRRKNSKKLIKRNSCNLEVLDEGTAVNTSVETVESTVDEDKVQQEVRPQSSSSSEDNNNSGSPPRRRQRLFKSLSAGSDLDKLKLISEQSGGKIHSLVNLAKTLESPEIRRKSVLKVPPNPSPTPSSNQTSSVQSINKLADSVENLREKLTMHSGIFFPMTKKEQELENLMAQTPNPMVCFQFNFDDFNNLNILCTIAN